MDAVRRDTRRFGLGLYRFDQPLGATDIEMRASARRGNHRVKVQRTVVVVAMQMQGIAEGLAQGIAIGHERRAAARVVKGERLTGGLECRRH